MRPEEGPKGTLPRKWPTYAEALEASKFLKEFDAKRPGILYNTITTTRTWFFFWRTENVQHKPRPLLPQVLEGKLTPEEAQQIDHARLIVANAHHRLS